MAIKVCMMPHGINTSAAVPSREEIVLARTTNSLEIASDDGYLLVRVPYGSCNGVNAGKVLFSAPHHNVSYAVHI